MITYARVFLIVHLDMSIPTRWLTGKTNRIKGDNFLARCMGLVVDLLKNSLMQIQEDPKLFLDENFMIGIFSEIEDNAPKLKEYLLYPFENNKLHSWQRIDIISI